MRMVFFHVPVFSSTNEAEALNRFLNDHPNAMIDRQLILDGQNSAWAICCTVLEGKLREGSVIASGRKQVDYREILEPDEFARYAILRELRNRLAREQSIPAYSIFSNAQLAEIVQLDPLNRQSMAAIEGIGEKRVERYADVFISALQDT